MNSKSKIIKLSKNIYVKESILKAAFVFSDKFYLYIDDDTDYFLIKVESKNKEENENVMLDKDFVNEVIAQTVRYNIMQQTKNIRELILGRALASTMINDASKYENEEINTNLNDILVDWFDKYDIN